VTSRDIVFDPVAHRYTLRDQFVPNVTHILMATGVTDDLSRLPNQAAVQRKRDIGTALHADSHAYDDGQLRLSDVHEEVRPYMDAWLECRATHDLVPLTRERCVFDPTYWYAGTLDGVFLAQRRGINVLADFCVGDSEAAAKRYQMAAYQRAYQLEHPDVVIHERWAIELDPSKKRVPYRVLPYLDYEHDHGIWKAIATTYHARPTGRRRP
jgi:hypothetical protein